MTEFRETYKARDRLLAHYRKLLGIDIFPIEKSDANVEELVKIVHIEGDEFLITQYSITHSFKLLVTSKRLVFYREAIVFSIRHEQINAVYLEFPYKKPEPPHKLNLVVDTKIYIIQFQDVHSLVEARNEIYRIIDTLILNWNGAKFNANKADKGNFEVINLPDTLAGS